MTLLFNLPLGLITPLKVPPNALPEDWEEAFGLDGQFHSVMSFKNGKLKYRSEKHRIQGILHRYRRDRQMVP